MLRKYRNLAAFKTGRSVKKVLYCYTEDSFFVGLIYFLSYSTVAIELLRKYITEDKNKVIHNCASETLNDP